MDKETQETESYFLQLLRGCPFINFEKCKAEKCYFYVTTNLSTGGKDCMFRQMYAHALCGSMVFPIQSPQKSHPSIPHTSALVRQASQNFVSILQCLDGLCAHPETPHTTRLEIAQLKQAFYQALQETSGGHEDT